ncbi:hypothetical protein PMAYCL1PPCAC_20178, partial [Pristionchus mayeri]
DRLLLLQRWWHRPLLRGNMPNTFIFYLLRAKMQNISIIILHTPNVLSPPHSSFTSRAPVPSGRLRMDGIVALLLLFSLQQADIQAQGGCMNKCDHKNLQACGIEKCKKLIKKTDELYGCEENGRLSVLSARTHGRLDLDFIACDCDK